MFALCCRVVFCACALTKQTGRSGCAEDELWAVEPWSAPTLTPSARLHPSLLFLCFLPSHTSYTSPPSPVLLSRLTLALTLSLPPAPLGNYTLCLHPFSIPHYHLSRALYSFTHFHCHSLGHSLRLCNPPITSHQLHFNFTILYSSLSLLTCTFTPSLTLQ